MDVKIMFKNVNDKTDCVTPEFVHELMQREPIHQHTTLNDKINDFTTYFESMPRYEYTVKDGNKLIAIMVITDHYDQELGQRILTPITAYSTRTGALFGGYRELYRIAKHHGINWLMLSKTDGYKQVWERKKISVA